MSNGKTGASAAQQQELCRKLNSELAGVFDAHFVCSTAAAEIATALKVTTLVGVSDPQREYYDVWISDGAGDTRQERWASGRASLQQFIDGGGVVHQGKFGLPVSELVNSDLWLLPQEDLLAIALPFPSRDSVITPPGVLCLIDPPDEGQSLHDLLGDLGRQLTVYLDRAFLRQRVDRQEVEFGVISDISRTLTSTLSLEEVFRQLTGPIRRTLNVESLSVGMTDPHTGDISFVDMLMGPMFAHLPPVRVPRGQGIAGWVAEHGEPVIINDTYADKRFYSRVDRQSGFQTRSMICIPLRVEERTIGVLQAINRISGLFSNHDLQLMQAIAGPLAAAIENARLHDSVVSEKRRFETILASMSEGILTTNADGIITHSNEALASLLLSGSRDLVGRRLRGVVRLKNSDIDGFLAEVLDAETEFPQIIGDLQQSKKDSVPVLISGAPVRDEQGEVREIIFGFSDLRQVLEVERMREDLFHAIAHELRTPLATILMYARLLREGKARDVEKASRFLGVIERESDRLQKMVRQMMRLAKQEAREMQRSAEPIDLRQMLDEVLPPLTDRATQKGLVFRRQLAPELPKVLANRDTLIMVIENLVDNAIKFTMSGNIRISASANAEQVILVVADEGIGIPPEALPNLFKRFYRTQSAVERGIAGTGLGLYMVKQGVEHYNGAISVESTKDEGTTVVVRFPIAED